MNRSLPRPITEEEIETYQRDGLVCLRGMFDSAWIERLRQAADAAPEGYGDAIYMWVHDEALRELAFDSPVGEIAATLMRSKTCGLLMDIFFIKKPGTSHFTPWHHDQPYYRTQGTQLCGMWIGLDDTTLENGGMKWIRGSHKWGKMFEPNPFDGSPSYPDLNPGRERVPDIENNRGDYDIVHFDTAPGDCIVDQSLVLHAGGPNPTDRPRRAITYALYGDNARYADLPPTRGVEDSRDFGLKDGEPFPADHEYVPRIWPKRPRAEWPRPTEWKQLPGEHVVGDYNSMGLDAEV